MKKWFLLLLMPLAVAAKDFIVVWDPSSTPGVMYRVWMAPGGGSYSIVALTSATSVPIVLTPGTYSFYVTALGTNESVPSNIYRLPPPAALITGVGVATNSTPPVPTPTNSTVYREIEAGVILSPMGTVASTGASGSAVESLTANAGDVTLTLQLPTGVYVLWCRLKAVASNRDSVFVSVDGIEDVFGNEAALSPNFQWLRVTGGNGGPVRSFTLTGGPHTIRFRCREAQVPLDALYITNDPAFTP